MVFPSRDIPSSSDALVVVAAVSDGHHQLEAELVDTGVGRNFVVSNPSGGKEIMGFEHCDGDKRPETADDTWCMKPTAGTTMGEAKTVGILAEREGWTSATVVTNRPHTRRVRTTFEARTTLEISVVPIEYVDIVHAPVHIAREIAGFFKFWATNPC